jgi:SAM-dependent methyltransferase
MNWTELDWPTLDRLRDQFLRGSPGGDPYWQSASDLDHYDKTFGARIGWKWEAVLDELQLRRWAPARGVILDWGCGSGIASRRVLARFGVSAGSQLVLWDRSPIAASFAHDRVLKSFPDADVTVATSGFLSGEAPIALLLVSHVMNEVTDSDLSDLRRLCDRAKSIIWVEPGTHEISRKLGVLRDALAGTFGLVAPCTHSGPCPVVRDPGGRDWCHHFARPPAEVFTDSNWAKFGQRAGIDLRSLPYAFIALDRGWVQEPGWSRVIGRPEFFKPYARLLDCSAAGLRMLQVQKRSNPALYKALERSKEPTPYKWETDGDSIVSHTVHEPGT